MTQETSLTLLAVGIITSSFFGSWHCAGMCGPIASLVGARKGLIAYHGGRLLSYTSLGAIAGFTGHFFLANELIYLRWGAAILLAGFLFYTGLGLLIPQLKSNAPHGVLKLTRHLQKFAMARSSFAIGFLTALLPCGWLYTYVTAAVATQSPLAGAATLFLFWLGSLPALSAVPWMLRTTIASAGLQQKRIAGGVLITAAIYSIVSFYFVR